MKKDEVLSTMPLLTVNPSELENKKLTVEKAMRYLQCFVHSQTGAL